MKKSTLFAFVTGLGLGVLLAPKKGSEIAGELKVKLDDLYLQVKEFNMDEINDKIEEIKIETSKLDFESSREIVSKQSAVLKEKLHNLIVSIQENEKIEPALEGAVDSTKKAIISVIDFIDENDLIVKTKTAANKAKDVAVDAANTVKDKSEEVISNIKKDRTEE